MFAPGTPSSRRPKIPEKFPYDPRGCDHEQPDVECATSLPQSPRKQNDGRQCAPPPEPSPPRPHALVRCAPFHEPVRRMDPRASRDTQYHATQPRAAPKTHTWPLLTLGLRTTEVHDGPASYARGHTLPACKCARAAPPPNCRAVPRALHTSLIALALPLAAAGEPKRTLRLVAATDDWQKLEFVPGPGWCWGIYRREVGKTHGYEGLLCRDVLNMPGMKGDFTIPATALRDKYKGQLDNGEVVLLTANDFKGFKDVDENAGPYKWLNSRLGGGGKNVEIGLQRLTDDAARFVDAVPQVRACPQPASVHTTPRAHAPPGTSARRAGR